MAMGVLGSTQVLLTLLGTAQDLGDLLSVDELWSRIASGDASALYPVAALEQGRPDPEFLADLAELEVYRLIASLPDGRLKVTPLGRLTMVIKTSARAVASPLLAERQPPPRGLGRVRG